VSVQRAEIRPHLQRILSEESRLLVELERMLERETLVLQAEDVAAIQNIGSARHGCVERLTRLDAERGDLCRMLSFGGGTAGLKRLLDWAQADGSLREQWQSNLQVARRCKDLNDRNGAIVSVKLGRVQQLLGQLRGNPPPSVYGPKAARYGAPGARNLGRA
jgi:flagellar biosynthesis/type III secretory pathway chaperone